MTADEKGRKMWRNFAHSVAVATASVLARHELTKASPKPPTFVKRFTITPLAAAGEAELKLPGSAMLAQGGDLQVTFEDRPGEIWVALQILRYAALRENAGQEARLVSTNGAINYAFRFSGAGQAVCVLSDDPNVRAGLKSFAIHVATD
jgi:hypothetical protein